MSDPGFAPFNPPQLPREQRQVAGCDCGAGPRLHVLDCSLLRMPRTDVEAAVEVAEAKVRAHVPARPEPVGAGARPDHGDVHETRRP